jgi:hypothetical protein
MSSRTSDRPDKTFTLEAEKPKPPKPKYPFPANTHRAYKPKEVKPTKQHYQIPVAAEPELWFRHTHWAAKRKVVGAALAASGASPTQLDAFANCGADCVVQINPENQEYRLRATYCHNRHCEPCQRAKANMLAANLRDKLGETSQYQYRFITLTLKHNNAPLRDQITRLYAAFKAMRKTKFWQKSQIGGAVVLEVKWKPETRHWHPHLHIIAEGGFMRQEDLAKHWLMATGDSKIVDIRSLSSGADAAHYVAKYVSKGTNNEVWQDMDAAQEWILAMRGVRTAATYGTWRGFKLLEHTVDDAEWRSVGMLKNIVLAARTGDKVSIALLDVLAREKQYNPHRTREKKPDKTP